MASKIEKDVKNLIQSVQPTDLLRIVLDNPNGWYFPNQLVTGKVIIRTKEKIKSKGVYVNFVGKAKTSWATGEKVVEKNKHQQKRVLRSGEIVYANEEKKLWSPTTDKHLPLNETQLPFSFRIPLEAPPTFEGNYGHIRYVIKATIDRPWFLDAKQTLGFTVLPFTDLRQIASAFNSICLDHSKQFTSLFGRTAKISAKISIPKSGFVSGESIPVTVDVKNESDKKVAAIEVELHQNANYFATVIQDYRGNTLSASQICGIAQDKTVDNVVAKVRKDFDQSVKGDFMHTEPLRVPAIVPSFNSCQILHVYYTVKVFVVIKSQDPVILQSSILIGTVPTNSPSQQPSSVPSYAGTQAYPNLSVGPIGTGAGLQTGAIGTGAGDYNGAIGTGAQFQNGQYSAGPQNGAIETGASVGYPVDQIGTAASFSTGTPTSSGGIGTGASIDNGQSGAIGTGASTSTSLYPTLPSAPPPDYDFTQMMVADVNVNNEKRFSTLTEPENHEEAPPQYTPKALYYPNLQ